YAGPSWGGIIQSGICFEDVQENTLSEVQDINDYLARNSYLDKKDAFVDKGRGRNDPKLLGFAGRMGRAGGVPNLYGISWREESLTEEERRMIESDPTAAIPEEVEQLSFGIKEETGESLRDTLGDRFQSISIQNLLDGEPEKNAPEKSNRDPTSCVTYWRPEQDYTVPRKKADTALWPWDTS
ncbi:MAG: hypothetical protein ABEJ72_11070, partial [Candidatus Aenigmatarchaeota archaeon]